MHRAAFVLCGAFSLALAGCGSSSWLTRGSQNADPYAPDSIYPRPRESSPRGASIPRFTRVQTARGERVSAVAPADIDRTGAIAASSARYAAELSPDTRLRIAHLVMHEYMRDGLGPAEIGVSRGNGATTEICVEFRVERPPYRVEYVPRKPAHVRTIVFSSERGARGDFVIRRKPTRHAGDACAGAGEATAFLELTRIAARAKACGPRDKRCLAITEAAGREPAAAAVDSPPMR
jgi:hypothetical protein